MRLEALPHFQYKTPTVQVDDLVLDAAALNAYIRRAESAYNNTKVQYCIGQGCPGMGKAAADSEVAKVDQLVLDCTGFAWWTTYRRGIWAHAPGPLMGKVYWVEISQPLPGATVSFGAPPGRSFGHSGVIIAPGKDGEFETLDSSNEGPPKGSEGSIYYRKNGRATWLSPKRVNPKILVSTEAIISKGGVPYPKSTNLYLAAAKHPVAAAATVGVGVIAAGWLAYYLYRKFSQRSA